MKKYYILPALILTILFGSCSDFLEEEVRGQENLDTYFKTEAEAESFVTGCYNALTFNGWWQVNTVWLLSEMTSDDGWMGNTTPQAAAGTLKQPSQRLQGRQRAPLLAQQVRHEVCDDGLDGFLLGRRWFLHGWRWFGIGRRRDRRRFFRPRRFAWRFRVAAEHFVNLVRVPFDAVEPFR